MFYLPLIPVLQCESFTMVIPCSRYDLDTTIINCTIQDGDPCPACEEDIGLAPSEEDVRLAHWQYENRRKIRTKLNAERDPFILKLPPEIACHIFPLSMGDRRDRIDICQLGKGLPTPFLLGAVCSGWRQLARSTPELWSKLTFSFCDYLSSKNRRNMPHLIADWLGRSGNLPLTLRISYNGEACNGYPYPLDHETRWNSVIEALNMHSGRWCDVHLELPRDYIAALRGTSAPNSLCKLSFSNSDVSDPDDTFLKFKMNINPSPTTFEISGFYLTNVEMCWDNLVHLTLKYISFDGVLKVIRDAPLLETCSLQTIVPSDGGIPTTSGTIVHHPQIRALALSSLVTEVFTELLNSLELPFLESCQLTSYSDALPVDPVISFIKRSACGLKTFRLIYDVTRYSEDVQGPGIEDCARFVRVIPHLQLQLGAHGVTCCQ